MIRMTLAVRWRDDQTHLSAMYYTDEVIEAMERVMLTKLFLSKWEAEKWMDLVRAGANDVLKG
jgi:hypothetical protein